MTSNDFWNKKPEWDSRKETYGEYAKRLRLWMYYKKMKKEKKF